MGRDGAEHQIVIADEPQSCFDALVDYEGMPEWSSSVKACEVLARDRAGRGVEVAWRIDAKLRPVSYTLGYEYEEPHRIGVSYVDGDVKDLEGEYILEDRGDRCTLVTLSLRIDPGMWLPGKAKEMLSDQVMKRSLEDLKRHLEGAA